MAAEEKQEMSGMSAASEYVQIFMIDVSIEKAVDLKKSDTFGKSDPYCRVTAFGQTYTTKTIMKTLDPVWNEQTTFVFFADPGELRFEVWDWDKGTKDDSIGDVSLSLNGFFAEGHKGFQGKLTLQNVKKGEIYVQVSCKKLVPTELEEKAKKLTTETEEQKTNIQNLQQKITDTTISNDNYTKENADLNIAIKQNKETISEKEQDIAARLATQEELKQELSKLEDDKKVAETERDTAKTEMDNVNSELEKLLSTLEKAQTENDNLTHDHENLEKQLKDKKAEKAAEEAQKKKQSTASKKSNASPTTPLAEEHEEPIEAGPANNPRGCCIVM